MGELNVNTEVAAHLREHGGPGPDGDDPHKLRHELIEVFEAVQTSLSGKQTILYDTNNVNSWFQAMQAGDKEYADFLVRRMTPDYRVAFEAWIKTDPIHNLKAPLGPRYMPQWSDPLAEKAAQLDEPGERGMRARRDQPRDR